MRKRLGRRSGVFIEFIDEEYYKIYIPCPPAENFYRILENMVILYRPENLESI